MSRSSDEDGDWADWIYGGDLQRQRQVSKRTKER